MRKQEGSVVKHGPRGKRERADHPSKRFVAR